MAEGSWFDGFQGAKTGPAGGPFLGRWNSRGRAMTFQVWGWRREDASQVLAWVPDAEGGRGAAMPRRTPGEPFAGVLGRPEPFGQPCCGEEGRQGGGSRPGQDAETGPWPCGGCDQQDISASPGGARLACKRSWGEEAAGPQRGPASEQLQIRPLSPCRIASHGS